MFASTQTRSLSPSASMATVDHSIGSTPLPPVLETGAETTAPQSIRSTSRRLSMNSSMNPHAISGPPLSPSSSAKNYNNTFANWHNFRMNNMANASANYSHVNPMPSPPSTVSSTSYTFSAVPSPFETSNASPNSTINSYFPASFRSRSKSMSIPSPTTSCPNCGLRRPSNASERPLSSPPLSSASVTATGSTDHLTPTLDLTSTRPHLPIHLHNQDCCPDDSFPSRMPMKSALPVARAGEGFSPHIRHHRRQSSSLCYAESLVTDAAVVDTGAVPADVKTCWESKAESIARKVCMREVGGVV